MISRSYRTFVEDNKKYTFSPKQFRSVIATYINNNSDNTVLKIKDVIQMIADHVNTSVESVMNWKKGYNGPGDLDIIKEMAQLLGCEYTDLLEEYGTGSDQKDLVLNETGVKIEMTVGTNEKDIIISIIQDMVEIVDLFANNGFVDGGPNDEITGRYYQRMDEVGLKIRENMFYMSGESCQKLENILLEIRRFIGDVAFPSYRWNQICKAFKIIYEIGLDDLRDDPQVDWDTLINTDEYLDEDDRKYLESEIDAYSCGMSGGICWESPIYILGAKMGAWFMEIIKHDFPELFIDNAR